ncbi:serine--tRNA ligase [Sphingomonas oligophenolica]|uniref:Serine--tRNA ligase n=1 Tax=Sphingomonas oligophenolica TaxID=301154 RepID=A0A502CNC8_9SPHN|nr:serine--tRNA ligase [Sphingomonas oligophenolica]TPG14333.1 serine--tRNA ligase [Sphingomonas oligophenolica]
MHDIRAIRDDPTAFDAALAKRGVAPQADTLIALDETRRAAIGAAQEAQAKRNDLSKTIGQAKAAKDEARATALMAEVAALKDAMPGLDAAEAQALAAIDALAATVPNLPADDVPAGADEGDNVMVTQWGAPHSFAFEAREHDAIGPALGLDFETGVAIAGARFTLVRGGAARLQRAIGQFMLDRLVNDQGYEEVAPPVLVRGEAMVGTGQLPKFAEDSFRTTDDRWLIPTGEVPLTNIVREKILSDAELPLRFAALTQCFRSEAGSAGRDTRGYIRQHQFEKVEMVSIVTPDASEDEHERMTRCAEGALEALELPYRRMLLCAGDMGFTAAKTYDLEVWLPGQARYREISSCSTCTDFQARRMNARYRPAKESRGAEKATRFVHTLNGSGLAVGRTLVAVIENYQQADGSVVVPAVLRPYMGGVETIAPQG